MWTDINILHTHRTKSESRHFILNSISMIRQRYDCDVVIIRTDNEKSFSDNLKNEPSSEGITFEENAPSTLAQNDHAERKRQNAGHESNSVENRGKSPPFFMARGIAYCMLCCKSYLNGQHIGLHRLTDQRINLYCCHYFLTSLFEALILCPLELSYSTL